MLKLAVKLYTVFKPLRCILWKSATGYVQIWACYSQSECRTVLQLILSLLFSDLDLFSSEERGSVYVKEGQGAVLLCAPPPHYPGTDTQAQLGIRLLIVTIHPSVTEPKVLSISSRAHAHTHTIRSDIHTLFTIKSL